MVFVFSSPVLPVIGKRTADTDAFCGFDLSIAAVIS
jgi:hypothetical protein